MNILVIGSGGREHALAWRLAQSPRIGRVYVAPGNAGTARKTDLFNVPITAIPELVEFARKESIALTVVGPEAPLADGIVDAFRAAGLKIFGPTSAPRSSKARRIRQGLHGRGTAFRLLPMQTFTDARRRTPTSTQQGAPIVIKADGLAAGKGVVVAMTLEEAHAAIDMMLVDNKMGRRRARGDRGVSGRRGSQLHRHGRRQARAGACHQPGPQAAAGRRPGPEHRRHGRLFAGAGADAGHACPGDARSDPAGGSRHGEAKASPIPAFCMPA